MTNPLTGAPYTRRELRELEQQGKTPPVAPAPELVAVVESSSTPPTESEPVKQAPPALTRREARLLQEQGISAAPVSHPSPSPLVELVQAQPAVAVPTPEPLPPVFTAPTSESGASSLAGSGASLVVSSRTPGDVMTTTSSLILPVTPIVDLAGPLGNTGEIVTTGQIALPAKAVSRGTIPLRLEDEERVDAEVVDAYVTGEIGTQSQPIRASQAVSGRGDDSEFLLIKRTRWGSGVIVTVLLASAVGLAAVTMLVLSLTTGALL